MIFKEKEPQVMKEEVIRILNKNLVSCGEAR